MSKSKEKIGIVLVGSGNVAESAAKHFLKNHGSPVVVHKPDKDEACDNYENGFYGSFGCDACCNCSQRKAKHDLKQKEDE